VDQKQSKLRAENFHHCFVTLWPQATELYRRGKKYHESAVAA